MKVITKVLCIFIAAMAIGCNKENKANDDAEIRYRYFNLEHSGWKSKQYTQSVEDINFTAVEVPLPYYILKDIGTENLFEADSIYQENKRERVIEFEFKNKDEEDLLDSKFTKLSYEEGVKYLSFNIEKDFKVITSKKDTISCSGVTFERNFKTAPYHKLILFFTDINPDEQIQLVYEDNLFKKGTLKFKFQEKITKLVL
jgi:hypothetical protein